MKKLQGSLAAKVCAWIVLIAAAFSMGVFGVRTVLSVQSVLDDSWQHSARYYSAMENRRRELLEAIRLVERMQTLEQKIEENAADAATYADYEALQEQREAVEQQFARTATWFRFRVLNAEDGKLLGSNLPEETSLLREVREVRRFTFTLTEDGDIYSPYDDYYDVLPEQTFGDSSRTVSLVLEYGVPEEVKASVQDEFYWAREVYEADRSQFDQHLTGLLSMAAITLAALVWVLWTAGHRTGTEGVVLTWQERIWFDLYAVVMIPVGVVLAFASVQAAEITYRHSLSGFYWSPELLGSVDVYPTLGILGAAALCTCLAAVTALLLRTFAVRVKARCLAESTLLCRAAAWMARAVHEFVRTLPLTWKALLVFVFYVLFTFWLTTYGVYDGFFLLFYWWFQLVTACFLAWWVCSCRRLRQGTRTIAQGNLEYQIDTKRMPYDLRLQAEDLNNISAGLSAAVDERMKSERFKAELITNVSHDLKTPLTSIINYVNLLKSTEQSDPKALDYIEVLDRKSQRLKKLTEDLVEASKASTGVLSVTREKIGMSQLIDQALGEWEERLTQQRLTLVATLPEGETWVYADGRHLWRVMDNLLSNCSKYALEGTRVYLDLERGKGQVALSVKNISRDALNVPAERLMERFVRGEESRSTEGSGLGLSIARSLTELQGGTFELSVDGDLFKAIVTLPQAN